MAAPVLELEALEHRIQDRVRGVLFTVTVDKRITIPPRSFAAILGPSGCGKTTLLSILGLLRRPDKVGKFCISHSGHKGEQVFDIADLWKRDCQSQIEGLRRQHIGFALQSGDLLSSLTVHENIAVPIRLNGATTSECDERVRFLMREFGLDAKQELEEPTGWRRFLNPFRFRGNDSTSDVYRLTNARINTLSGGEYQRVVLARSIAHRPRLAFVDEPTSALNNELAKAALEQLRRSIHEGDYPGAVMMITHEEKLAKDFADIIIRMAPEPERAAGRVVEIIDGLQN